MRAAWLSTLALAVGACATGARAADDIVWHAAAPKGSPAVALGQPIPIATCRPVVWSASSSAPRVVVRAQSDGLPPPAPPPGVGPPPPPPPPSGPPPGGIPWSPSEGYNTGPVPNTPAPGGPSYWDKTKELFDLQSGPFCGSAGRKPFQSDHAFDGFISPVSNPFFFLDPRSLTEVRPIFLYQSVPTKNYAFQGGNIEFFGMQASLAFTERLSVILNKLGGLWINPGSGAVPPYDGDRSGFAEIDMGFQYTFLRNTTSGTLGAAGLTFEFPAGSKGAYENTGDLSLFPYLTLGQNFGRSSYGSFNALGEIGYSFAVDDKRSDFFMTSLHLDYDIGNLHKIYPLLELNWRYYTGNGSQIVQTFEGGDLINFGATEISGRNNLTLAPGVRYKFNECAQMGTALEFPVVGTKDLLNFRWTLDFILRY